jgi:hypothetical protein
LHGAAQCRYVPDLLKCNGLYGLIGKAQQMKGGPSQRRAFSLMGDVVPATDQEAPPHPNFESPHRSGLERRFSTRSSTRAANGPGSHGQQPQYHFACSAGRELAPANDQFGARLTFPSFPKLVSGRLPSGAIGITNPAAPGVPGQQSFGTLPGNPGSATYDPNAALPSLNDQGSALAPTQGVRADARRAFLLYRLTRLGVSPEGRTLPTELSEQRHRRPPAKP